MAPRWFKNINFGRDLTNIHNNDIIENFRSAFEKKVDQITFDSTGPIIEEITSDDECINQDTELDRDVHQNIEDDIQHDIEDDMQDDIEDDMQDDIEDDIQHDIEDDIQQDTEHDIQRRIEDVSNLLHSGVSKDLSDSLDEQESNHEPSIHQRSIRQRSIRQPSIHEPSIHQPSIHESSIHEPSIHQPSIHEPSIHQPSIHEPSIHQPSVHESSNHEPSEKQPRRSTRKIWKPTDFARGERPIYKRDGETFKFAGIQQGFPASNKYGKKNPTSMNNKKFKPPKDTTQAEPIQLKRAKTGDYNFMLHPINKKLYIGFMNLGVGKERPIAKSNTNNRLIFRVEKGTVVITTIMNTKREHILATPKTNIVTIPQGAKYIVKNCGNVPANLLYIVNFET